MTLNLNAICQGRLFVFRFEAYTPVLTVVLVAKARGPSKAIKVSFSELLSTHGVHQQCASATFTQAVAEEFFLFSCAPGFFTSYALVFHFQRPQNNMFCL